jgi:hypothetical protein
VGECCQPKDENHIVIQLACHRLVPRCLECSCQCLGMPEFSLETCKTLYRLS